MKYCQHKDDYNYIYSICLHEVCAECLDEQIKDLPLQDGMIYFHCDICNQKRELPILLQREIIKKDKEILLEKTLQL